MADNTDHDNEVSDSDKLKAELDTLAQLLDKSFDSLKTVKELEKSVGNEKNEEWNLVIRIFLILKALLKADSKFSFC